jgi:molybdopterin synthase catalytic subunit
VVDGPPRIQARITADPIDPAALLGEVGGEEDGAVILFVGVVRNHADGRSVRGMRYETYRAMAEEVLGEIVAEAADRLGAREVGAVHRVGELTVGEVSVAIAASSPHRAEAFDAARYVIEEIKKRLPVWKREHYVDGEDAWVEGTTPPAPTGEGAGGTGPGGVAGGRERSTPSVSSSRVEPSPATAREGS